MFDKPTLNYGYDPCTTQILAQVINRNEQEKQLILKLIKDLTRYFDNIYNLYDSILYVISKYVTGIVTIFIICIFLF